MLRVAIIGGYGNFGSHVARALAPNDNIQLIIAGRDEAKGRAFSAQLAAANQAEYAVYDIDGPIAALAAIEPDLVINMVGPYNGQSYAVANAAIQCGAHYCDIADAREFVVGIAVLDAPAKRAGVAVLAGASSIPALTAAYLDKAVEDGIAVHSVRYGISGAEQANRGAGTVASVLSYVGEKFTTLRDGQMEEVTGWGGIHAVRYEELGTRWFGQANAPDLELFKDRYPTLRNHSFWAGHEIAMLHFGTAFMGLLRRARLLPRLDRLAEPLVAMSKFFNWLGKGRSGFHMVIDGHAADGAHVTRKHSILARQGHGPFIPCVPVILIARRLASGEAFEAGARPCLGVVSLAAYREALSHLDVSWIDQ